MSGDPRDVVELPRWIPLEVVAEYLEISPRHVEKLIGAGEIEAIDVGLSSHRRTLRASVHSVRRFLERRAVKRRAFPARDLVDAGRPE